MRYEGMSNHDLRFIVVQQLNERRIDNEVLEAFLEEGKSIIQRIFSLRDR